MKVYEGKLVSNGKKYGIVVSRFKIEPPTIGRSALDPRK